MESIDESGAGYPEEQPGQVADRDRERESPQREGGTPPGGGAHGEGSSSAADNDDGKATGNPAT